MSLKSFNGFVASLALVSLTAACGQENAKQQWHQQPAPTSQEETGFNVSDATVAEMENLEALGGTIRVLNQAHGMYEVTGLSEAVVRNTVPHRSVEKNIYFENLINDDEEPQAEVAEEAQLQFCGDALSSEYEVEIRTNDVNAAEITERTGAPLTFSLVVTKDTIEPGSARKMRVEVDYEMLVEGPRISNFKTMSSNAPLSFTPTDLGMYMVVGLPTVEGVQCWVSFPFGVTANTPYKGVQNQTELSVTERLSKFLHLEVLNLEEAWNLSQGKDVIIAITDTGVNYNHPDLADRIAINKGEIPNNGKDDDHNGFVDDVYGWDFIGNDNRPYDDQMHGTHCSGLAGGRTGMAPKAKILPVKVMNAFGGGDLGSIVGGLKYAVDSGARIVNVSLGSDHFMFWMIKEAIDYGQKKGVLFVVAAGNESVNIDQKPVFPASLPNDNILTVAATGIGKELAVYTNTGAKGVDLAAPGGNVLDGGLLSTAYENSGGKSYVRAMGTSMATPVTVGAAALVLGAKPSLTYKEVKQILMDSGDLHPVSVGKSVSEKFLNPTKAIRTAVGF